MIRVLVPSILLFLLPFGLYFLWLRFLRSPATMPDTWGDRRYVWLALAGLILALGTFLLFTDLTAAPPEGIYVPPRYEDGRIVPGHFKSAEPSP